MLDVNQEACDCPIDCQVNYTVKAQKIMESIVRIVNLPSVAISAIYLAVNGTVTNLPVFIQNILNCVRKTNKAFTGLDQHGDKWLMTTFSFWGGVTL